MRQTTERMGQLLFQDKPDPALYIKPVALGRVARDASRAVVSFVVGESSFSARSFYGGLGVQMR